jgi:hypothetical protein
MSGDNNAVSCPLCDWTYTPTPFDPRLGEGTLANVFGQGVLLSIAMNNRAAEVEVALRKHLSTHALEEWIRKVVELRTWRENELTYVCKQARLMRGNGDAAREYADDLLAWATNRLNAKGGA